MIFLVVGMHRSGTSLVAGLLHQSGIPMGDSFRRALPENKKGFFEDENFRTINDRLLGNSGFEVKNWLPNFDSLNPSEQDYLDAEELVLLRNSRCTNWGWKDPRNCLTLDFWIDVLQRIGMVEQLKLLVVRRTQEAVIKSLQRRKNIECSRAAAEIIEMYEHHMSLGLKRIDFPRQGIELYYDDLLYRDGLMSLQEFCGVEFRKDFIDPSLDHWSNSGTR